MYVCVFVVGCPVLSCCCAVCWCVCMYVLYLRNGVGWCLACCFVAVGGFNVLVLAAVLSIVLVFVHVLFFCACFGGSCVLTCCCVV